MVAVPNDFEAVGRMPKERREELRKWLEELEDTTTPPIEDVDVEEEEDTTTSIRVMDLLVTDRVFFAI